VLKANAYGHGLIEVTRLMVEEGADYLGAAFLEEALMLRQHGIKAPILVLGSLAGEQIPAFLQNDLTLTASSVEKLRLIDEAAHRLGCRAKVHLKIDTGMERVGVHYYSAEHLLEASVSCQHVEVEGIYTHFANADAADLTHARLQLSRFQKVLEFYPKHGLPTPLRHCANSAAILALPESHMDLVRPGILLYGIYPSAEVVRRIPVRAALSWKSQVCYFKVVQPGHPVSYGSTWETPHSVRVVTVPCGYGDGYFRALSNRSQVLIHGRRYPVVGRVCMDQMMVNLEWDSAFNGDVVTLLGPDGEGCIPADELAQWAGTIPYEVLTNINTRVPRVYVE
jgi:alanine racemase